MTLKPARRMLVKLSRALPKVPNKSINAFLERMAGICFQNPFRTKTILAGSLNASAELLCAKNQTVITVMESWDHVVKIPNGYTSEMVFAWNDDLKNDWQRVQCDQNVRTFYPLKLRYARDVVRQLPIPVRRNELSPFFVYAVASTRRFCIKTLVEIERKLIRDLARAAEIVGWDLLIKPRPNGEEGEFSAIVKEFPNVRVGSILDQDIDQPANYFLSDDYNNKRFSEIVGAEFVINAFTTFGLDSAAAGIPVLQIDIRNADGYADSKFIYENYHLKNYLLPRDPVLRISGDFLSGFIDSLQSSKVLAKQYTTEIAEWLFCDRSEAAAIDDLVDRSIALAKSGT